MPKLSFTLFEDFLLHPNYLAIVCICHFIVVSEEDQRASSLSRSIKCPPSMTTWTCQDERVGDAVYYNTYMTKENTSLNSWSSHIDDNVQSTIVTTRQGTMWKREMWFLCLVLVFMLCVYVCLMAHVCCLCFVLNFFSYVALGVLQFYHNSCCNRIVTKSSMLELVVMV